MIKQIGKLVALFIIWNQLCFTRSPFRPIDPTMPCITAQWQGDTAFYNLRDYHLEEYSVFRTFDEPFFMNNLLPVEQISFRNEPEKSVSGKLLQQMIDELIDEVYAGKKTYKNFIVLRNRDFNCSEHIGLMILKFKNYPFVVKLFMETPRSLTSPYSKGMVPLFSFYMGGGINRHLIGFTRIKNLKIINEKLAADPYWSVHASTPRKWFLKPKKSRWIELSGCNIGPKDKINTRLPGTYCIIADAIESTKKTSMLNKHDNEVCLHLCKFLDFWVDPHIDNFMWEKDTDKLVIVDTEHFPTFMGFRENMMFESYVDWLTYLAGKFLDDTFFRSKKDRKLCQLEQQKRIVC